MSQGLVDCLMFFFSAGKNGANSDEQHGRVEELYQQQAANDGSQ